MICKNLYCIDVTKEWLENATPNSHVVRDMLYFEYKGEKYFVDNKKVVLDYSKEEREVALWLENKFGGEIFMLPRINKPDGIMTADYLWNNEYWDLKKITGYSKRAIDNAIKRKKAQASNFILDITYNTLDQRQLLEQVQKIYQIVGREWVNKIIIKNGNDIVAIYKRK